MAHEESPIPVYAHHAAIERFLLKLHAPDPRNRARAMLYRLACAELASERKFASCETDAERLAVILDRWSAGGVGEHYRIPRKAPDFVEPAYHVSGSIQLLSAPRTKHLASFGLWLALATAAGKLDHTATSCIILPEGSKLTDHHLAWFSCVNEALGNHRARLLVTTWTHDQFQRGFAQGEGFSLADKAPTELQHMMDTETGERIALRLSRLGAAAGRRVRYGLDFVPPTVQDETQPHLHSILCSWSPQQAALTYGRDAVIEHLEVDHAAGWFVAKFAHEHHLKYFDNWQQDWVVPSTVALFGESGYDRAYYIGQGCWEDMERIDREAARRIIEHGWFGDVTYGEVLHIVGPDGVTRYVDRSTGQLLDMVPPPFRKEIV